MDKHSGAIVNESQWPQVVDDYSHLPQHYQHNVGSIDTSKQHVPQYAVPKYAASPPNTNAGDYRPQRKRACGLTIFQLIVLILLGIWVVTGAILGGILGSGVVSINKSKSGSSSVNGSGGDTHTYSSFSIDTTIPTRTVTRYPTTTQNGASSATGTGLSANYCNNGTTYTSSSSATFLIMCAIDWPDNSIRPGTGVHDLKFLDNQATLAGCLDTCSTWPSGGDSSNVCRAVVWNYKAQCFLKNQTGRIADTFYQYDYKYVQAGVLL